MFFRFHSLYFLYSLTTRRSASRLCGRLFGALSYVEYTIILLLSLQCCCYNQLRSLSILLSKPTMSTNKLPVNRYALLQFLSLSCIFSFSMMFLSISYYHYCVAAMQYQMVFFEGSVLPIEWTVQHGCGGRESAALDFNGNPLPQRIHICLYNIYSFM
jgi:hypothetical protein